MVDLNIYSGKRVLLTGHTGFKGTWLSQILIEAGAEVYGISLKPEKDSLFNLVKKQKYKTQTPPIRRGLAIFDSASISRILYPAEAGR